MVWSCLVLVSDGSGEGKQGFSDGCFLVVFNGVWSGGVSPENENGDSGFVVVGFLPETEYCGLWSEFLAVC